MYLRDESAPIRGMGILLLVLNAHASRDGI